MIDPPGGHEAERGRVATCRCFRRDDSHWQAAQDDADGLNAGPLPNVAEGKRVRLEHAHTRQALLQRLAELAVLFHHDDLFRGTACVDQRLRHRPGPGAELEHRPAARNCRLKDRLGQSPCGPGTAGEGQANGLWGSSPAPQERESVTHPALSMRRVIRFNAWAGQPLRPASGARIARDAKLPTANPHGGDPPLSNDR